MVLKFGKQAPKDARALARMIAATEIGQPAVLLVWRDHKEQTITATVAGWPDEQPSSGDPVPKLVRAVHVDLPDLGLQTAAITAEMRAKYKLDRNADGPRDHRLSRPAALATRAGSPPAT